MLFLLLNGCGDNIGVRGPGALHGEECADQETCAEPLVCAREGICLEAGEPGTAMLGESCLDAEACAWGMVCSGEAECVEEGSSSGVDGACESDDDCQLGLACEDGACVDLEVPYWAGVACEQPEGDLRVLFEVPDLPASSELEFYRLPFPNDTRLDGSVDLSGHAWPPDLDEVREQIEAQDGFPISPTVVFRLSGELDTSTLDASHGDSGTVWFASLDEDASDYGLIEGAELDWDASASRWACGNRLAVRSDPGRPLLPGGRYAVWLSKGLRGVDGASVARDADFEVLMGDQRPGGDGDLRLVRSWDAYADLRIFLARGGFDSSRVLGAAVFTVGDPGGLSRNASWTVEQAGVSPLLTDLEACETSSCAGGCVGLANELTAEIALPLFDAAFLGTEGQEQACVHLSLPEGEAPAEGWPVVLLSQDEGQELTAGASHVAALLSARGLATVTLDLPHHGARGRQDQRLSSLPAVADFQQDRVQASFDLHQLLAGLEASELALDLERVHLVGVGAGGEAALGFATSHGQLETVTVGAIGGNTRERLVVGLGVSELRRMLSDPTVDAWHPGVAMLHAAVEPADAQVHARELWKEPRGIFEGMHTLHLYVTDEPALGDQAQVAWQRSAFLPTLGDLVEDHGQSTGDLPAQDNVLDVEGERHTAGSLQLEGDREVVWQASERIADFVASSSDGDAPVIE
jgi:hypothetical protein